MKITSKKILSFINKQVRQFLLFCIAFTLHYHRGNGWFCHNSQLMSYEKSLDNDTRGPVLTNSMVTMMVRGVFSGVRFPYAHFPCSSVTGEQLFQPLWEAKYTD